MEFAESEDEKTLREVEERKRKFSLNLQVFVVNAFNECS